MGRKVLDSGKIGFPAKWEPEVIFSGKFSETGDSDEMGFSEDCGCEHIDLVFLKGRIINGRIGEEVSEDLILFFFFFLNAYCCWLQLNHKTLVFM